eukprot:scaffold69409_cov59-Phaeocystis_antarctica.AAC.1
MSERDGGTSKGVALRAAAVRPHGGVEARFGGYNQRRLRRRGGGRRGGSGLGWGGGDGGGRNVGAAFAHQCGPHLLASLPVLHLGHLASQLPQAVFRLRTPSGGCFAARSAFCMTDPVRRCASLMNPAACPAYAYPHPPFEHHCTSPGGGWLHVRAQHHRAVAQDPQHLAHDGPRAGEQAAEPKLLAPQPHPRLGPRGGSVVWGVQYVCVRRVKHRPHPQATREGGSGSPRGAISQGQGIPAEAYCCERFFGYSSLVTVGTHRRGNTPAPPAPCRHRRRRRAPICITLAALPYPTPPQVPQPSLAPSEPNPIHGITLPRSPATPARSAAADQRHADQRYAACLHMLPHAALLLLASRAASLPTSLYDSRN